MIKVNGDTGTVPWRASDPFTSGHDTGEYPDADDAVNHPAHYTSHPSGIECITITEAFGFNVGNAIKYLWRAGLKSPDARQDLEKALWYVQREIQRINIEAAK